ncbi:MAG: redox-sensing transcriptional repressor Rex [Elusimicrobium sp.]|nr:redox-sensing transcriptional repressor Rex [Elusimicrobium sp.]
MIKQKQITAQYAPEAALRRMLVYLEYLKGQNAEFISSAQISARFNFTAIQVRKDIAYTGFNGRPKNGYKRTELIHNIEGFLGINDTMDAFLIGAGNLGKALASYGGFAKYSLNIVAVGDDNPQLHGRQINGKTIFPMHKAVDLIKRMRIKLAIIAVSPRSSQAVADTLAKAGIKAIWCFSSERINCPPGVIVQNEDLGASLSVLWQKLLVSEQAARKKK